MRILLNLIPIKKGGGLQVATNFLNQVSNRNDIEIVFVVIEGSQLHERLKQLSFANVITIKNSLFQRILFEKKTLHSITINWRIDIIFTLFGPGLYSPLIPTVTGSAYSNIFFPEIPFWEKYSIVERFKRK